MSGLGKLPPYGRALYERRALGERLRVCYLLVGALSPWRAPKLLQPVLAELPKLAVKVGPWELLHDDDAVRAGRVERYDWRIVSDMTVLAIDVRGAGEMAETEDGFDAWLWLLADVQRYARDVLMFSPLHPVVDPPGGFAPERDLETWAFLHRRFDPEAGRWVWPRWWPHDTAVFDTRLAA